MVLKFYSALVLLIISTASIAYGQNIVFDFGPVLVSETRYYSIGFGNDSNTISSTVSPISLTGSQDFSITQDTCSGVTFVGRSRCGFVITFTPTSPGPKSGRVFFNWTNLVKDPDTGQIYNAGLAATAFMSGIGVANANPKLASIDSVKSCSVKVNSSINIDTLSLSEDIPLAGSPFYLNYESSRLQDGSTFSPKIIGLGGWTPSLFHFYDIKNGIIYFGDGSKRNIAALKTTPSLVYATNASGSEIYAFGLNGRILETTNALTGGLKYKFLYDSNGLLKSISDSFDNTTSFEQQAGVVKITSPYGQLSNIVLDDNQFLKSVTNPNNEVYSVVTNASGLLTHFKKPMGQESTVEYDSSGFVIRDTGAGGDFLSLIRTFDADSSSQTVKTSTAQNIQTQYTTTTSSSGSTHATISSDNSTSTSVDQDRGTNSSTDRYGIQSSEVLEQDPRFGWSVPYSKNTTVVIPGTNVNFTANVTKTAEFTDVSDIFSLKKLTTTTVVQNDPSRTFTSVYDGPTRTLVEKSPNGRQVVSVFNEAGQPVQIKSGSIIPQIISYDERGRLSGLTQADRTLKIAYDQYSNVSKLVDPMGHVTSFQYDKANRVTRKILPDNRVIAMSYDANGNVTSITPPGKAASTFSYNLFDLVGSYLPPAINSKLTGAETYVYDLDKRVKQVTRPDGSVISYAYDSVTGALNAATTPSGVTTYRYLANSPLLGGTTSEDGIETQHWYMGSLVAGMANPSVGAVAFTYTKDAHVKTITAYVNGLVNSIALAYDNDRLLTGIGSLLFTREAVNGQITKADLKNTSEEFAYNSFGEVIKDQTYLLSSDKKTPLFSLALSRDKLGRISRIEQSGTAIQLKDKKHHHLAFSSAHDFKYDASGRLVQTLSGHRVVRQYNYDSNGNRIAKWDGERWVRAEYDAQDRLIKYGKNEYQYDNNGNLVKKITHSHRGCGDDFDKIKREKNLDRLEITSYVYDTYGRLKQVTLPNKTVIKYQLDAQGRRVTKFKNQYLDWSWLYQNQTQIAYEYSGDDKIQRRFVYGTKSNIPDYYILNGKEYRIISDHVGTPKMVVDSQTGEVIERLHMDEFGDHLQARGTDSISFGFAGGIYDYDTKLVHFGAREYDPETGRWLTKDPIAFGGGDTNLFGYVGSDPVNWIDPEGTAKKPGDLIDNNPISGGGGGAAAMPPESVVYVSPNGQAAIATRGSTVSTANNGAGLRITPPGSKCGGGVTRLMEPNTMSPNGYGTIQNSGGQYTDGLGNPVESSSPAAHIQPTFPWRDQ